MNKRCSEERLVSLSASFCHLAQTRAIREEGPLIKELSQADWFWGMSGGHFLDSLLISEGPSHCGQHHP